MEHELCGRCRYWQPTGLEDSGLRAIGSEQNWHYTIGDCTHPGRAEALYQARGLAEWLPACEYWARQRQGRRNLDDYD